MAARRRSLSVVAILRRDSAAAIATHRASERAMRARVSASAGSSVACDSDRSRSMPMLYRVARGLPEVGLVLPRMCAQAW